MFLGKPRMWSKKDMLWVFGLVWSCLGGFRRLRRGLFCSWFCLWCFWLVRFFWGLVKSQVALWVFFAWGLQEIM